MEGKSVLELRVNAEGERRIVGDPPEQHVFSARWIERELGRLARVSVVVQTDAGDVEYELTGFEPAYPDHTHSDLNFTAWEARKVDDRRKRPKAKAEG